VKAKRKSERNTILKMQIGERASKELGLTRVRSLIQV
jgi:hypothetical protein